MTPRRFLLLTAGIALVTLVLAPLFGAQPLDWRALFHASEGDPAPLLFWQVRVPRVATGFLAGAALAVVGAAFQALFRNPLATPFTLGVSSAASLGAALHVRLGLAFPFFGLPDVCLTSFLAGLGAILLVYGLTRLRGGFSTARLLLAGVAASFLFSSLIMVVHYTTDAYDAFRLLRRLMGSLSASGTDTLWGLVPITLLGAIYLASLSWELDLLALGEELALSRGVDGQGIRRRLFFATCLMESAVVALCGPIGFVGLMVPHICRLMIGNTHRFLLPASFLVGGTFLTICDTMARTLFAPAEMPVGVITSLLGGPFFLWLLLGPRSHELEV
ncbi:MAG: iron ABC transporter permease [Candidatus Riflebacteria bacterium]|nr:iron ABC transporter permease [Candidatus Riflebacteria bacterium]